MDAADDYTVSGQNFEIEQTVQREGGRLLNFIRMRVRDETEAQDVLQDVFGELVEAYRGVETIERVTAWLFRVARNKIADRYRRRGPDTTFDDLLPDLSANPEVLVVRDDVWDAIQTAIEELPPAQRQAFVWHELEGMSFREMANRTRETENALRLRKHYAMRALRARLAVVYNDL